MLANARLHRSLTPGLAAPFDADGFALADIAVAEGKIAGIAARGEKPAPPRAIELGGRIVLPAFVDCHTHIDKGHIWPRKPNPDGSFMGALERRRRRSRRALERRRRRAAHGVLAAHAPTPTAPRRCGPISTRSRRRRRSPGRCSRRCGERWQGRIELQAACLFGIEAARDFVWLEMLARRVAAAKRRARQRHLHGARPRIAARPHLRAMRSSTASISISTPTRPTMSRRSR